VIKYFDAVKGATTRLVKVPEGTCLTLQDESRSAYLCSEILIHHQVLQNSYSIKQDEYAMTKWYVDKKVCSALAIIFV
jgi:predicted RNA-binding protein YlxR (DUF448 family)